LGQWCRKEAAGKGCRVDAVGKVRLKNMLTGSANRGWGVEQKGTLLLVALDGTLLEEEKKGGGGGTDDEEEEEEDEKARVRGNKQRRSRQS